MKIVSLLFCVITLLVIVVGCAGPLDYPQPSSLTSPQDFGNGVYYFPCTLEDFAGSLAKFKSEHPDLMVTSIAGDSRGAYGTDLGYFVNTELKWDR